MFQCFKFVFIFTFFFIVVNCNRLQLSCEQIRAFVDGHNLRRYRVARGLVPGQPPAADLQFMVWPLHRWQAFNLSSVWDDELAEKAAQWAENGLLAHNPDRTIASGRWEPVGENVYISNVTASPNAVVVPNIEEALDAWFSEHRNYGFEPFQLGTEQPIAHYTQMVWADSRYVGCGISQRHLNGWRSTLFVCDYGPTGNYFGQQPYRWHGPGGFLRCATGMCDRPYGMYC